VRIVTSDMVGSNGFTSNDINFTFNGTSAACPNAAGVMALILSVNNDLTGAQARYVLESTCDTVGGYLYSVNNPSGNWSQELGYGRVNAYRAVQASMEFIWNCMPMIVNFSQSQDTVDLSISGDIYFTNQSLMSDSILWDFGDGTTDTAQNPIHTYDSIGIYTVALTGFKDTCSNTVTSTIVVVNTFVGINKENAAENINFYAYSDESGTNYVHYFLKSKTGVLIEIYDVLGRKVQTRTNETQSEGEYSVNISSSIKVPGIYYVRLSVEGRSYTKTIREFPHRSW